MRSSSACPAPERPPSSRTRCERLDGEDAHPGLQTATRTGPAFSRPPPSSHRSACVRAVLRARGARPHSRPDVGRMHRAGASARVGGPDSAPVGVHALGPRQRAAQAGRDGRAAAPARRAALSHPPAAAQAHRRGESCSRERQPRGAAERGSRDKASSSRPTRATTPRVVSRRSHGGISAASLR